MPAGEPVDKSGLPTTEGRGEGALISALYCPVLAGEEASAECDGDEPYSALPIPCWFLKGSPKWELWVGENMGDSPSPAPLG